MWTLPRCTAHADSIDKSVGGAADVNAINRVTPELSRVYAVLVEMHGGIGLRRCRIDRVRAEFL